MRHARKNTLAALALAVMVLIAVPGCSGSDESRLSALEDEVKALRQEAEARDNAYRKELAQVRKNLETIQELLKIDKGRSQLEQGKSAPSEEDLDAKTKSFMNKNLDRLLDLTRKLLDKMEKELDEQLQDMKKPAPPQGDEI